MAVKFAYRSGETWADPWDDYRVLRDEDPVHEVGDGEFWVLSRFDDVFAAARGMPPLAWCRNLLGTGVVDIPVDYRIAAEAVLLADRGFHPDPMDQVIAATAIVCGHELATFDEDIISWAESNPELQLVDPRR